MISSLKQNIITFVKVEFMIELLDWSILDRTNVPNVVLNKCTMWAEGISFQDSVDSFSIRTLGNNSQ